MKRLMILNIIMVILVFSAFAQKTIEVYDVNKDKQTTVIVKDTGKSDKDILSELDLDDYTVGEEVYITQEMWDEMQEKKEKNPIVNESPTKDEIVIEEKVAEKPVRAKKVKSTSSKKKVKKKKKKKSKKYRMKKPKRKKMRSSRRGKMACYSF